MPAEHFIYGCWKRILVSTMMHSPSEAFERQDSNAVREIHEVLTASPCPKRFLNMHIVAGAEKGSEVGLDGGG